MEAVPDEHGIPALGEVVTPNGGVVRTTAGKLADGVTEDSTV